MTPDSDKRGTMKNSAPAYVEDTIRFLLTNECDTCHALTAGDGMPKHLDWHRAEAERVERMLDRSEAR